MKIDETLKKLLIQTNTEKYEYVLVEATTLREAINKLIKMGANDELVDNLYDYGPN